MKHDDRTRKLRESWEENAEAWVDAVRSGSIESRRLVTDEAILHAALSCSPRSVLDVGCGEGWLARALSERGIDVVGIDASQPLIDAARERGGARFETCPYEELAALAVGLGAPFDMIVCNFSLLDEDLAPILRSMRGMLRPQGKLLIQTVHPWVVSTEEDYADGWRVERFAGMGDAFRAEMPWYFRTLTSWVGLLDRAGFRVERLDEPRHPETGRALSLLLVAQPT